MVDEDGMTPDKRAQQIFSQMDTNLDNRLSWEEFSEGSRADPRIVDALAVELDGNTAGRSR